MKKMILGKPDVGRYTNPNHIEFHKLGSGICVKHAAVIGAQSLIDDYNAAMMQENSIFKWIRRSEFTEKKADADHRRDSAYAGILGVVRLNLKHFDPQMQDSAGHVYNLLAGYGQVAGLGYDAETAAIDSIIGRLRSEAYAPAVQELGLETWLNELEMTNAEFKTYVDDTMQEEIDRPDISPKEARRQSDAALRLISERVEALVILNSEESFTAFIEEYNTLVKNYNMLVHERYGRLHARTDIAPAIITPIAPQPFAGKPVFVIPEVSLRTVTPDGSGKIIELVFSCDFTVAYKNNFQPGTATLSIQGIGKYKGEIVTTFNIE